MLDKALRDTAKQYHLSPEQLREVFRLLHEGYGVPYLMRYHKELTAGLKPGQINELVEQKGRIERLTDRRTKVLKKLKERGLLGEELEEKIREAATVAELMDYYIPYRPRKRSRSRSAMAQGLGSVARMVLSQEKFIERMGEEALPHVDSGKGLGRAEDVLEGVAAILCDWIAEEKTHRDSQRRVLREGGTISCTKAGKGVPPRLAREFKDLWQYEAKVSAIHPYRMLRIVRGKRVKALKYRIDPPLDQMCRAAAELYLEAGAAQYQQVMAEVPPSAASLRGSDLVELNGIEFLCLCIKKSVCEILAPILVRELDQELCKNAEKLALEIVSRGVRSLLAVRPVAGQRVLGIKGGYRTGCKLAALDESGNVLAVDTVHPHIPRQEVEEAKERIAQLVEEHKLALVAIGDGTACQETESVIAQIIQAKCPHLSYAIVSEAGLEAYAKSRAAAKELPDLAPEHRASVSIGRRLSDPLMELLKVDPLELCTSEYAQDVDEGLLQKTLNRLIEDCLCEVGVELNTVPECALRHMSGLDAVISASIVAHRRLKGPFKSREQLKEVPGLAQKTFRQIAGFVKVAESDNPLDRTRIHPHFYVVAEKICEQLSLPLAQVGTEEGRELIAKRRYEIQLSELEKEFGVHYLLLKDIIDELVNPWPDPREREQPPVLRQRQFTFDDLQSGQVMTGTVRNIVDFGVFVDIGVGEDGLIHISELADRYVHSPFDVVSVGEHVRATVVDVDPKKRRIALTMRSAGASEPARRNVRREPEPESARVVQKKDKKEAARERPGGSIQRPQSTLGWGSRRVEKAKLDKPLSKTEQQILKSADAAQKRRAEPQQQGKKKDAREGGLGGLLGKVAFATVERRGKPSE